MRAMTGWSRAVVLAVFSLWLVGSGMVQAQQDDADGSENVAGAEALMQRVLDRLVEVEAELLDVRDRIAKAERVEIGSIDPEFYVDGLRVNGVQGRQEFSARYSSPPRVAMGISSIAFSFSSSDPARAYVNVARVDETGFEYLIYAPTGGRFFDLEVMWVAVGN